MPKICPQCRRVFEDSFSYCPHCKRRLTFYSSCDGDSLNNIAISDWLQYLEHNSSTNQNFIIGFTGVIVAGVTVALMIIISNNENPTSNLIDKIITAGMAIGLAIFLWWLFTKGSYRPDALRGKSAQTVLDDFFSGHHPELNNPIEIQNKWIELQRKIERISGNSRQDKATRKNLINNRDAFRIWYDNPLV